jgi:hypothetical protein
MSYEEAMNHLEKLGFVWDQFREFFPFGDIALREGNYQRLAEKCLTLITEKEQQARFLDLLDAQGCVFLEQCWVLNELCSENTNPFQIHAHFASAWLQINSNLRYQFGLSDRDARGAMLNLKATECLAERMVRSPV